MTRTKAIRPATRPGGILPSRSTMDELAPPVPFRISAARDLYRGVTIFESAGTAGTAWPESNGRRTSWSKERMLAHSTTLFR